MSELIKKPKISNAKKIIVAIIILFIGVLTISLADRIGEDVPADKIIINQVPFTGTLEYWTTPGFQWQKGGRTLVYDKTFQIWFSNHAEEGEQKDQSVKIVFNDAGIGWISGSGRVMMPRDKMHLERLRTDYENMDELKFNLIYPTIRKVIFSSGPLMSSFESYAAKKNDLMRYIEDQIEHGIYKTISKEVKVKDPISGEDKIVTVAELVPNAAAPGGYERQEESPFAYYGLGVKPVTISDIKYEDKIIRQIDQQQTAYMAVQTAKAEALKAKQDAIKAEEQGKAKAAQAKWKQEEINAKEIALAEKNFKVSALAAKTALEDKKKVIAKGQAEAESNRLKVSAGLTPQEKAEWNYKTQVGIAKAWAERPVPSIVVEGDSKGGSSTLSQTYSMENLILMMDKINKKK